MLQTGLMVFLGGATGAVLRELLMLLFPTAVGAFPFSIFAANIVASAVLGYVAGLREGRVVSDLLNAFSATGVAGGLSTFSSFAYATMVLMTASESGLLTGTIYLIATLVAGYAAVALGHKLGRRMA